jgi:hypothetical protein
VGEGKGGAAGSGAAFAMTVAARERDEGFPTSSEPERSWELLLTWCMEEKDFSFCSQ